MAKPKHCRGLLLTLAALLVVFTSRGASLGVQLYGAGSPNTNSTLSVWTASYLFARDDVSITYDPSGVTSSLAAYGQGDVDFICLDRGIDPEQAANYDNLIQFPLTGQALVMAYNIPTLNATDPRLVIERETLGLIWSGAITKWNDPRILEHNQAIAAKLPDDYIMIGYNDNDVLTIVEVIKRALESFSDDFHVALSAANRTFARMPALNLHAEDAGGSTALRLVWLAEHSNSLTFANYADAHDSGFPWMDMYNKAGTLVTPSTATIQSAMADFLEEYSQNNFTVDIYDAEGVNSWPFSYMTFFSMSSNITTTDCTNIQEMLQFIAWVHTNDEYAR